MVSAVKIIVDKKEIKIVPDLSSRSSSYSLDGDNEFNVTVINGSPEFASFQIELSAPGLDPRSQIEWYRVEPEVCTKKPPGDQTVFQVVITKPPIPAYDTTLELTLRVFSIEFPSLYTLDTLSLRIEKPRIPLKIYLPIKEFKVYPGDKVEIPVLAYNLSPKPEEITLKIDELDVDWFAQKIEKIFPIEPGDNVEENFSCHPPKSTQTFSKRYEFFIQATTDDNYTHPSQKGILEILPQGEVTFACEKPEQTIPLKRGLFSRQNSVPYELAFINQSNLDQTVRLNIPEESQKKLNLQLPSALSLEPGQSSKTELFASQKRPLFGFTRTYRFEVSPTLINRTTEDSQDTIPCKPNTKLFTLKIKTIIPLWLQLGGGLLLLLLLWLTWFFQPRPYHTNTVNSVRFDKNAGKVFSASNDHTIRRWRVDNNNGFWKRDLRRLNYEKKVEQQNPLAVQVIQEQPGKAEGDSIFAVGLENGDIELRDFSSDELIQSLYLGNNNRISDLDFTTDSNRTYLFSSHGNGFVYQWNLRSGQRINAVSTGFSLHALAVSEAENEDSLVVIAGRYNKLFIWNWKKRGIYEIQYDLSSQSETTSFTPIIGQNHYIESLAIAKDKQLLAMADNYGYITLWDMQKLRDCLRTTATPTVNVQSDGSISPRQLAVDCEAIVDRWQDGHDQRPVRSVALTPNGCYLASTGDDGRVILWAIDENKRRVNNGKKELAHFPDSFLNSVDIKDDNNHLLVASDGSKNRVRIYRSKPMKVNESCHGNSRY